MVSTAGWSSSTQERTAASPWRMTSSSTGQSRIVRIRSGWKAATRRRIHIAIRERAMNGVWATVIGSGIFHGVNPAMGWLFAAALGLQHGSRKALLMALPPLALGHAVAVMFVTTSAVAFGLFARTDHLRMFMGVLLIAW